MNIAILGYGSMGKRHAKNLRAVRPDWPLIVADPCDEALRNIRPGEAHVMVNDWRDAVRFAQAVVIASPMERHWEQITACRVWGLPFLVEKPVTDNLEQTRGVGGGVGHVGFCYRFHRVAIALRNMRPTELRFVASDDLVGRYGPTVLETMGSHAIDLALWMLGPAEAVELETDGLTLTGSIRHRDGESWYNLAINCGPRQSFVNGIDLYPDEAMYRREMGAWVGSLGGRSAGPLATLEEGLAVAEVSARARRPIYKGVY